MAGGRPKEERLSDALSGSIRTYVSETLKRKGMTRMDLLEALPPRRKAEAELPLRSQRWIDGALSPAEPLARKTAIEILLRMRRLRILIPDDILTALQRIEPGVLILPGEAEPLAKRLSAIAGERLKLDKRVRARLEDDFLSYLAPFERIASTERGRAAVLQLTSGHSPHLGWRLQLSRTRQAMIRDGGRRVDVPSLIEALEMEFAQGEDK